MESPADRIRGTARLFRRLFILLCAMFFFLVGGRSTADRIFPKCR